MALTDNDVRQILGMVARGDNKHDIAAWFGENQGRVADAEQGKFGKFEAAAANTLPPKGPPGTNSRCPAPISFDMAVPTSELEPPC